MLADRWEVRSYNKNLLKKTTFTEVPEKELGDYNTEMVEYTWGVLRDRSVSSGWHLKDGPALGVTEIDVSTDGIIVDVKETSYKRFISGNISAGPSKYGGFNNNINLPDESCGNMLGIFSIVETNDDKLLLLNRSDKVSSYRGCLSSPGGGLGHDNSYLDRVVEMGMDCLSLEMANFIEKEIFVGAYGIDGDVEILGLSRNWDFKDYALNFSVKLAEDFDLVENRFNEKNPEGGKYTGLVSVNFEEESLSSFLSENHTNIPGTVLPGIVLAGRDKFGDDWVRGLDIDVVLPEKKSSIESA